LDHDDKSLEKVISRTVDEIEAVVFSYFQNIKTTSLYFVIGATEQHSEAPGQRGPMSNALKRIFAGNTTSLFLSFTLLSFALYFIIGVYTVFLLIGVQLVALVFSYKIVYRMGSVRPNAERPLVTIASVRSNPETLKSISQTAKRYSHKFETRSQEALPLRTLPRPTRSSSQQSLVHSLGMASLCQGTRSPSRPETYTA